MVMEIQNSLCLQHGARAHKRSQVILNKEQISDQSIKGQSDETNNYILLKGHLSSEDGFWTNRSKH